MRIELPNPHPALDVLAARFMAATDPRRAEMILKAIGARGHKDGWLLRNGRLVPAAAAPYWATDLNALAAAERLVGLRNARYVVIGGKTGCHVIAGAAQAVHLRLSAASEREARGLAIVAQACLHPVGLVQLPPKDERMLGNLTLERPSNRTILSARGGPGRSGGS